MLHKDVLLAEMDPGEVDIKEFQRRLVASQTLVCICSHKLYMKIIRMIRVLSNCQRQY